MSIFELSKGLSVLLLGLEEILVPLLVELLVLFDVGLLTFFSLLSLVEDELLLSTMVILYLKLRNSVFGKLSFDVLAFHFASVSVLLKDLAKVGVSDSYLDLHVILDVILIGFLVESRLLLSLHSLILNYNTLKS
jgi:hypothetical protein